MITEKAMNHMELIAQQVGFSRREDYVWCRAPISAGDYKGSSTVAVVFADTDKAEEFLQAVLPDLISLASGDGEGVETLIRSLDFADVPRVDVNLDSTLGGVDCDPISHSHFRLLHREGE